jgi:hypothetical protein
MRTTYRRRHRHRHTSAVKSYTLLAAILMCFLLLVWAATHLVALLVAFFTIALVTNTPAAAVGLIILAV